MSNLYTATGNNPSAQDVRASLEASLWETFSEVKAQVDERYVYEHNIKRPYYHVTEVDEEQLENWRQYLDFEERQGDYERTKFLYERCLVCAANYEAFWFRYVRWMASKPEKTEEIRNIYQRASCIFVKITEPAIRLSWARFEESNDRADVAAAIYEAMLLVLPNDVGTMKSLVHLHRRRQGIPAAVKEIKRLISDASILAESRGALIGEWARMLWRTGGDVEAGRQIFVSHQSSYTDANTFWSEWLEYEMAQPDLNTEAEQNQNLVRNVITLMMQKANLSVGLAKDLTAKYMNYIETRCGSHDIDEAVALDIRVNGPSIGTLSNGKS